MDKDLVNALQYFWRARAVDEHGEYSEWSAATSINIARVNNRPTAPSLNNPVSGGIMTKTQPTLSVNNAIDPDNDIFAYEFELYLDKDLSNKVDASLVPKGEIICSRRGQLDLFYFSAIIIGGYTIY